MADVRCVAGVIDYDAAGFSQATRGRRRNRVHRLLSRGRNAVNLAVAGAIVRSHLVVGDAKVRHRVSGHDVEVLEIPTT
jgi:hypothetical protein